MMQQIIRAPFKVMMAAGLLCLAACSGEGKESNGSEGAAQSHTSTAPAMWQISNTEGEIEGWLFGTIHALPNGTQWRTDTLAQAQNDAEYLVVEVGELDDKAELARAYNGLAMAPEKLPLLSERVPPARREWVRAELARIGADESEYMRVDTWAAALAIAQKANPDDTGNSTDLALIRAFEGRKIEALESAEMQFAMFDSLPAQDQSDLLLATLEEVERVRSSGTSLADSWLVGDLEAIEHDMARGILADPGLRDVLLTRRNANWLAWLEQRLPEADQPLVAVGTAHLIGPDGLVAKLQQRGYTVERIQ